MAGRPFVSCVLTTAQAAVLAIAATVLAFIFIVPEKRREKMNAFGRFLQDLCSFKFLVVEKILQALYIFSTAFIVLYGVMQLFNIQRDYWSGGVKWMGGMGLLYIVLGPIVVRLSYELLMMVVLLVKNVIAINHKLADQTGRAAGDVFATPDVQELKVAVLQRKTQAPAALPRSLRRGRLVAPAMRGKGATAIKATANPLRTAPRHS